MAVVKEYSVTLVDMDKLSRELLHCMGDENSKLLFMPLAPGDHPSYPLGRNDNTYFNELGAARWRSW